MLLTYFFFSFPQLIVSSTEVSIAHFSLSPLLELIVSIDNFNRYTTLNIVDCLVN